MSFTVWVVDKNGNEGILLSDLDREKADGLVEALREQLDAAAWVEEG
jgi:hypothetical protein